MVLLFSVATKEKDCLQVSEIFSSALGNTKANRDFSKITEFWIEIAALSNLKSLLCEG